MKATYIRVSTSEQNIARQVNSASGELYTDYCSGSIPFGDRNASKKLKSHVLAKKITEVAVKSIDRLGRDAYDIQSTIELFRTANCQLHVEQFGLNLFIDGNVNPMFKMISDILANVAELERNNILERQRQGIELAKQRGVYIGRKKGTVENKETVLKKHYKVVECLKNGMKIRKTADICGVSTPTVQKVKKYMVEEKKCCCK